SPRLPYSATLGTVDRDWVLPQRGCGLQPKVAVLGYLGESRSRLSPIPKGLRPTAQGCRTRLPWVRAIAIGFLPQRGCGCRAQNNEDEIGRHGVTARVARNPFGVAP